METLVARHKGDFLKWGSRRKLVVGNGSWRRGRKGCLGGGTCFNAFIGTTELFHIASKPEEMAAIEAGENGQEEREKSSIFTKVSLAVCCFQFLK